MPACCAHQRDVFFIQWRLYELLDPRKAPIDGLERSCELRKKEERLGKLARQRDKAQEKCEDGNDKACIEAEQLNAQIEAEQDRPV